MPSRIEVTRALTLLGFASIVLAFCFPSVVSKAHALSLGGDSLSAIPVDGGVYENLTVVQMVTPTTGEYQKNTNHGVVAYAIEVKWFMDETPMESAGLSLERSSPHTPANRTWRAEIQNPSPGNHSFTFRVQWLQYTQTGESPPKNIVSWTEDFSGTFIITHHRIEYGFDEALNWNVVSGTWSTLNGSLDGHSETEGLIVAPDVVGEDFTLTALVKIASDSPRAEAAFCFRFADSQNFYWAGLGCWNHRVSISRIVDHNPEELAFKGDRSAVLKEVWYKVSVKVSVNVIMLYVNDVLELVVEDSTFTHGIIGIRSWNSHVLVDEMTVSRVVRVRESSRYQGFAVSQSDIYYDRWTQAEFDELADLGFNLVIIVMRWPYIENEDGTYRTDRIAKYHTAITLATNAGLKVFISFRVSNGKESNGGSDWTETWAGAYPTPDYVNRNEYWGGEYGRTRYVDFLEDMASEFGDRCGFVIWHFPYHMQGASESDAKAYYDETIPACIDALRTHCDDWLVVVPIHQREEYYRSEGYNGYPQLTPYPDTKLLYGAGHFLDAHTTDRHADRAVIEERYGEWDYDTQHMDEEYEWMNSWRQQYNREFFTPEYAGLYWYQSQLGAIPQSRLDAFTYSLELARKLNMSIGYWRISQRHSGSDDMLDESQSFELNHQLRDCMTANL